MRLMASPSWRLCCLQMMVRLFGNIFFVCVVADTLKYCTVVVIQRLELGLQFYGQMCLLCIRL